MDSNSNLMNSTNIDADIEKKENQFSNLIPKKDNQQIQSPQLQQQYKQYVNYNSLNNYAQDTNNIILSTRKRHLSSTNTSISTHTLNNNNYNEDNISNNPINNANYSRNINNGISVGLFYNTQNQNPSENLHVQNKNKKQKIEINSKIQQNQSLTQSMGKTINHHQLDDQIMKRSHQERVDSLIDNDMNNENIHLTQKEFDIPNSKDYIYTREVQPSLIQNSNQSYNVSKNN
jgi:hypothetical protein